MTEEGRAREDKPLPDAIADLVGAALHVGARWARTGLQISRHSIDIQVAAMRLTSDLLRSLSDALDATAARVAPEPAAEEPAPGPEVDAT